MRRTMLRHGMLLVAALTLWSFDLPKHWFVAGSQPGKYQMGLDKGAGKNGQNAATIKSIEKNIDGFGTLMQECDPGTFLGKRVRMSGYLKSSNVTGWAGFWMRVDGAGAQQSLSFDNMGARSIKGTTDWKKYEIVLDVPGKATNVAYGALIDGTGQIWFTDISFEIVDQSVPTTNMLDEDKKLSAPTNLDFKE